MLSSMPYFTLIFSLLIAAGCFFISFKMIGLYLKVKKWNKVAANIVSKDIFLHPKVSTSQTPYGIKAEYHYNINGIDHSGHQIYLVELAGGQASHMKSHAEKKLAEIEPMMQVFVNPLDATQSVMYCQGIGLYVFIFCMGIVSLLIGLGSIMLA